MITLDIFTIFPQMFEEPFSYGVTQIAKEKEFINIRIWDLRDFTNDPHRKVDDSPYGGGPGMVLKPEPIFKGVNSVKNDDAKVILLSPRGELYNQKIAQRLSKEAHLIFICGRYQGVDERVRELADFELSIGNYILSGGEFACMVIIESIVRLIPGVLKNPESLDSDSFGKLGAPLYTRPREFNNMEVPEVLVSGNHKEINDWREKRRTKWSQ
ncbi:tRNA (guanosine(37)-N1)-methyltransferase TrmD [candidate division WOR-3 bacterium]|nr:tRNA (guanosine(37)-N1)-methyltransferase TrmD [candidate division WOR-3 bacterium]